MSPTLTGVEHVDVDLVDPHPKNPRRDLGDLAELTASIKTDGVRNPIHVAPAGDRYVVLAGHRRRQAAIAAGRATVPVIIREDVTTDAGALIEMLVENLLRADLTPIEEATAYEQLRIAGVTAPQIAKRTGRARKTVDARLALMKLPEKTRDKVHDRQVTLDEAASIVEFASDKRLVRKLEDAAGSSNFRWVLQEAIRGKANEKARKATRVRLDAEGVPVVDRPANHWNHGLTGIGLTVLDDASDRAEARRAAHADCPHHAAWIEDDGRATYTCTDRAVHDTQPRDDDNHDDNPEDAADRKARAEQRQQDEQDTATAAAIRKAFVVDIVTGRRALPAGTVDALALAAAQYSIRQVYAEAPPDAVAGWLDVTLPEQPEKGGYDARQAHEEACERLVLDALAKVDGHRALLAVLAEWSDGTLRSWHAWEPSADAMRDGSVERAWLTVLQQLGYELTDWEAGALAAAGQWAVDNPDADDTPDDGE